MTESPDPIVEWHRVSGGKAVVRPVAIGAVLLSLGPCFYVAGLVLGRTHAWMAMPGFVLGGVFVVLGPIVALFGLSQAFKEDAVLAARAGGVTFERNGKGVSLSWDELDAVLFEAPAALVFRRREGEPFVLHERFDVATEELAKRFEALRRKASMHLL